ncbi:acyl-CoA synthetase [Phenylobacterium sp.]|uniref:acyl-CoA synthetase n=1 Tax=Phenylobacterium sp. TaxID=1871053 RepID=UPI002F3EFB51
MYPGTYGKTQPDKAAVVRAATGETLSYRQLDDRSNRLARLLHAHGLRRGDHVALYMENSLVFFDVIWACMRSGLYLTPINRYLTAEEAAYIVDNCDARVLIASAQLAESEALGRLSPRCDMKLAAGGAIPGFTDYEPALAAQPAQPLDEERLGSFMLYSSGTTGRPKGILRPLRDIPPVDGNPQMKITAEQFGFDASTVYLSPAPLYHAAPLGSATSVLQAGGTVVMMDKFEAATALDLIERYRVTHSQWVPTMFVRMLKLEPAQRARDLSSHRCAVHAAAPCPVDVKRQMIEWWGPILEEYYAATEGVGMAAISSREWLEHPGSVGRARGKPFHICDEAGNDLPAGEAGLIYGEPVSGVAFGYHKDAGKTAGSTHPTNPDWMTVGDVGYLDKDGYLYLTDRKAFMIISGGVNIYPQQIEDVLALHPKVADVAVIGVPNPDLGEEVKAVVEPAPGVAPSEALAQEILDFIRGKLGRQLTPRSVDFTDALPRLPTGKLYKKALKDRYWGAAPEAAPLSTR